MAPPKGFLVGADWLRLVREVVAEVKDQLLNTPNRPHVPENIPQAPETFVAYTSGIPAMARHPAGTGSGTGTGSGAGPFEVPGQADCPIFQCVVKPTTGNLELIHASSLFKTVLNLSTSAIPAGWVLVTRDKFGRWWCVVSSFIAPTETYLGKTTSIITALSGTTIGSGTAHYWRALTTTVTDQGTSVTVYNASTSAIASGSYVLLFREPFGGKFFAVPLASAGIAGVQVTTRIYDNASGGTYTWTKPANLLWVEAGIVAGGGGGGAGGGIVGTLAGAGGGGGGGDAKKITVNGADISATASVVVGQRGVGGLNVTAGTNGGASTFQYTYLPTTTVTTITAAGGLGGGTGAFVGLGGPHPLFYPFSIGKGGLGGGNFGSPGTPGMAYTDGFNVITAPGLGGVSALADNLVAALGGKGGDGGTGSGGVAGDGNDGVIVVREYTSS